MPSNSELIQKAEELAAELGVEITTEGMNNKALVELVSNLSAQVKAATDAPAERDAPEGVFVEDGKALTSRRGILGPGTEVVPEDFSGGAETVDAFIKSGYLVRK